MSHLFAAMNLDLTMPTVLLLVTLVATFLNKRVEGKLRGVLEEREFRVRDAVLLVASISTTIVVVVFIPTFALMALFLFAYSMLLFIFTYVFSDFGGAKASFFGIAFFVLGLIAGLVVQFNIVPNIPEMYNVYGAIAFYGISVFAFATLAYERRRKVKKERWYLALLPPALFVGLYAFFSSTPIWFPYLLNMYGVVFAVLIILYIGSLFTWKTTLIFAGLLTVADIILVLVTGSMVSAAQSASVLRLPVLISLPVTPLIITTEGTQYMSLGLGDFFFAGLLAIQTRKKYGTEVAILSMVAMTISFAIFEVGLFYYMVRAFPGTLMIICGWIPIMLLGLVQELLKKRTGGDVPSVRKDAS